VEGFASCGDIAASGGFGGMAVVPAAVLVTLVMQLVLMWLLQLSLSVLLGVSVVVALFVVTLLALLLLVLPGAGAASFVLAGLVWLVLVFCAAFTFRALPSLFVAALPILLEPMSVLGVSMLLAMPLVLLAV
jgi:hypothetical protein